MKIKRKGATAIESKSQGETVSLCPKCLANGQRRLMGNRVYLDEHGNVIPPKADAKLWRQCSGDEGCGHILPIYNLKREGRLTSELTPSSSPFGDQGEPRSISTKDRLGKSSRGKKNEWDFISDPDTRQELKEGSQLISFSES